jgi:hypothetical protein
MFEKATPEEKAYLDEYRVLAVRESMAKDEALARVTELEERLAAKPVERAAAPPAPAPAPPPAPEPPPPIAPASFGEWTAMPAAQKAAIVAVHGPDVETRLYEQKMLDIRMSNARRGFAPIASAAGGGGHLPESPYSAADYRTLHEISQAHNRKMAAEIAAGRAGASDLDRAIAASLNKGVGTGWGAGAVTPAGAPAPSPVSKARRQLGGGFGIRK